MTIRLPDSDALSRWGADLVVGRPPGELTVANPRWAVETLTRRGLAGLAWTAVQSGDGVCSPEMMALLEPVHAFQTVRGHLALEIADEVAHSLTAAGVEHLFFKGISLLRQGMYTAGERRLADIDLLVHPTDAPRAVSVLTSEGFIPWSPWSEERLDWVSAFTLERPGVAEELTVPLDLHWGTGYHRLRSGTSGVPGQEGGTGEDPLWLDADRAHALPDPAAEMMMIADHLFKHLRVTTHLLGFADLVRLLERLPPGGDAEALLGAHVRRRGIERRFRRLMDLLSQSFGAAPESFSQLPPMLRPTGRDLPSELELASLVLDHGVPAGRGSGLGLRWKMGGDPVADLVDTLFPGSEWLAARYPDRSRVAALFGYLQEVLAWVSGRGRSPLSPNQEFEGG